MNFNFTLTLTFTMGFTLFTQLDIVTSQFVQSTWWLTMLISTTCTGQASWCCQHCSWYPHLWIQPTKLPGKRNERQGLYSLCKGWLHTVCVWLYQKWIHHCYMVLYLCIL